MSVYTIKNSIQFKTNNCHGEGYIEELGLNSVFIRVTYTNNSEEYPVGKIVKVEKKYAEPDVNNFSFIKDTNTPQLANEDYWELIDLALYKKDFIWAAELRKNVVY